MMSISTLFESQHHQSSTAAASENDSLSSETRSLIPHVFLPLNITDPGNDLPKVEADLLTNFTKTLQSFKKLSSFTSEEIFEPICNTFDTWCQLQSQSGAMIGKKSLVKFLKELVEEDSLKVLDTFILYIRQQNTGLILTNPRNDSSRLFLSTFPAAQKLKDITDARRDLVGRFPTISVTIPKSQILTSECFANHLSLLTSEDLKEALPKVYKATTATVEIRETPDTYYATKWLTGILMDEKSVSTTDAQFPRVVKKLRDSVFWDSRRPFRRSGLWFTLKVALQTMLVNSHGNVNGVFLYKMIMQHFLVGFLRQISQRDIATADSSLIGLYGEMMGKVARRTRKLDLYLKSNSVEKSFEETFYDLIDRSGRIMQKLGNNIRQNYWSPLIDEERKLSKFEIRQPELRFIHRLSSSKTGALSLTDYLTSRKKKFEQVAKQILPVKIVQLRHPEHSKLLDLGELNPQRLKCLSSEAIGGILYDFEKSVDYWTENLTIGHSDYVWKIYQFYVEIAQPFYLKDPVGYSRLVLTSFKIIKIWDQICCKAFPQLLQHSPGVSTSIAQELLLPNVHELEELSKIEEYFKSRQLKSTYPGLLEEPKSSPKSFGARFAEGQPKLIEVRDLIINWSKTQTLEKLDEVHKARERCKLLWAAISQKECEFEIIRWKRTHSPKCVRCQKHSEYKRVQVTVFENPLPNGIEDQNAVMFEFYIPPQIGALRDLLYIFGSLVSGTIQQNSQDGNIHGPWTTHPILSQFLVNSKRKTWIVNLLSTSKLFLQSHYKTLHPTNPDADFIKPTGYNCHYGTCRTSESNGNERKNTLSEFDLSLFQYIEKSERTEAFKNQFKFRVEKGSPYSNLQWAIDGGKSTPNEVLTRQNECHADLSFAEFVEFGSIRCYYGLQLRNIYRSLTQMSISLKSESVFNIICQSLWETSPPYEPFPDTTPTSSLNMLRIAHQDLNNSGFITEFLELLDKIIRTHSSNWKDHYILLSVVMILLRIYSFYSNSVQSGPIIGKVVDLLHKCEKLSISWSREIEKLISSLTDVPRKEIDSLRLKMVEINICTAFTYDLGPRQENLIGITRNPENVTNWILAMARIYDNLVLIVSGENKTREQLLERKYNLRNLLRRVHEVGINLEKYLKAHLQMDTEALDKFVLTHYPSVEAEYKKCGSINWELLEEKDSSSTNVYFGYLCPPGFKPDEYFNTVSFQIDIIGGRFLVNNCPVSYLPNNLETHPDYQRCFPTKSFEVQPYVATYQVGRMITKGEFKGSHYSFYTQQDGNIVITEHFKDGGTRELIPHKYLMGNVAFRLVENYTHWLTLEKKPTENKIRGMQVYEMVPAKIEFFPRANSSPKKLTCEHPSFSLNLQTSKLTELSTKRSVVDISSFGFKLLSKIIGRLESKRHIMIYKETKTDSVFSQIVLELPRMGLRFKLQGETNPKRPVSLISTEYRGMKVSHDQRLDTLVGLHNGLLLEDAAASGSEPKAWKQKSILLIPHGKVTIAGDHTIKIDTDNLFSPPFFAYEVDDRLKQIKGGESQRAWLYLALLHAATSSTLPDPFTGVTGSEQAFKILQSGHAWSCSPFDEESQRILNDILQLVPRRCFYPPKMRTMESVTWEIEGQPLSPYLFHEGYQLLVEKLIEDSGRLRFLFPNTDSGIKQEDGSKLFHFPIRIQDHDLAFKHYWRRISKSTELGRISAEFDPFLEPDTLTIIDPTADLDLKMDRILDVLKISQLGHKWKCASIATTGMLQGFLMTGNNLRGIYEEEPFDVKEDLIAWSGEEFRETWLSLYNLARIVHKKKWQSEWIHILSQFSFRGDSPVALEHLLLLQAVAVFGDVFQNLDPPKHKEYCLTNETEFDSNVIKKTITTFAISWENWMDAHANELQDDETLEEFMDRMKPIYEEEIDTNAENLVTLIHEDWPTSSCDKVFTKYRREYHKEHNKSLKNTIIYADAIPQINILLNTWTQNIDLLHFVKAVEVTVQELIAGNPSQVHKFVPTRKALLHYKSEINETSFDVDSNIFVINFSDLMEERGPEQIDKELYDNSKRLFQRSTTSGIWNYKQRSLINGQVPPVFPLKSESNCPILKEYVKDLKKSWEMCHKYGTLKQSADTFNFMDHLRKQRDLSLRRFEIIKNILIPIGKHDLVTQHLTYAGIFPRITLTFLFQHLLKRDERNDNNKDFLTYSEYLRVLIGAYGILLTKEQQAVRMYRYSNENRKRNPLYEMELNQELDNAGHENWSPEERPEWLVFEIEQDLMIRRRQATVAEKMLNPDGESNALLQLNMGEGKTAVIVPIVLLSLTSGRRQLARATVLKPLFHVNRQALCHKIGGLLLNRRLYSFPCRRDFKINSEEANTIFEVYKECREVGGVVLTIPESRLSFQLKGYEKLYNNDIEEGSSFRRIEDWIRRNARDILDESDEILHVKYQLVYTLGKPIPVSGGNLRWAVAQKILKLVPGQVEKILARHGRCMVEIKKRKSTQKFSYCRLLRQDCYLELCTGIAKEVLNGHAGIKIPEISTKKFDDILRFLTVEELQREDFIEIFKLYPQESHREVLLILRGLLACRVICTALEKRWRVNYGVNPSGYRRMAVPFRAKDVAAERTEFGHLDIAIILTQLSYYYSGLNDEQLDQAFVLLYLQSNPEHEYNNWLSMVSRSAKGYDSICHLTGLNPKDFHQKTQILYPILRKNMATIDFWLSHAVYPHESKQFCFKIGTSPWDLCRETSHPTTGFSGTNDSKILLPKTITQKDLPELQGTNGEVIKNLLQDKNKYEELSFGTTGHQILKKLADSNTQLLLDVGALMLEMNNEEVARKWLSLVNENTIDGAIYFDQYDKLVVLPRDQQHPIPLELSTFRTRLDRVVIYLDDVHTRGTDLKIPPGLFGVCTLGKGVTKDKLVQGCMRMRKLGQGHWIKFWASQEVHDTILAMKGEDKSPVSTQDVLEWAIENSRQEIQNGFIHWAAAGVYQTQKLSAELIYESSEGKEEDLPKLASSCALKETTDLGMMYGTPRTLKTLPTIVEHQLNRVERELGKKSRGKTKEELETIVHSFGEHVVGHSKRYVPDLCRSKPMDEEQEREIEHELETQVERKNPPRLKPNIHGTYYGVQRFIENGDLTEIEKWSVKLPLVFKSTALWKYCQNDTWGVNAYASLDFARVIKQKFDALGENKDILRPPNWIVSVSLETEDERSFSKNPRSKTVLLFLSPFEVNHFLPLFHTNEIKGILHMFAPRLNPDQDTLLLNSSLRLPSSQQLPLPRLETHYNGDGNTEVWVTKNEEKIFTPHLHSTMLLFSGSTYFKNSSEQDAYCKLLGFCLQPRSELEEAVFNEGGIVNGFLLPGNSRKSLGYGDCRFDRNPEPLIRAIVDTRHGKLPMDSHVAKIIFHCTKPFAMLSTVNGLMSAEELKKLQIDPKFDASYSETDFGLLELHIFE